MCPAECKVCGGQATGYHYEVSKMCGFGSILIVACETLYFHTHGSQLIVPVYL